MLLGAAKAHGPDSARCGLLKKRSLQLVLMKAKSRKTYQNFLLLLVLFTRTISAMTVFITGSITILFVVIIITSIFLMTITMLLSLL